MFGIINNKEQSIKSLRKDIIESVRKTLSTTYELASLLWDDAAKCFPNNGSFNWDCAWFKLDLINKKLYADLSTYPNQFGACRELRYNLTASEFHQKAIEHNMSKELQCMVTEVDWDALFDEELTATIDDVLRELDERRRKQEEEQRILKAIVIPDHYINIKPDMELDDIVLELHQRYGSTSVWLTKESEKYVLIYIYKSVYSFVTDDAQRELSQAEALWVEQQIGECINNDDKTTWHSLPGGDKMTVKIRKRNELCVEIDNEVPLKKYFDLQHKLQMLTVFGSFFETEKRNLQT